jgi:polar amino acid transport system substrate-binding protein
VNAARRRSRRLVVAVAAVTAMLCASACSSTGAHIPSAHRPTRVVVHQAHITATGSAACDPTASLRPTGPPVVSSGSFVATIKKRGYLIAGVDLNNYHFGYFNPLDGQIEGFDIDLVRAVAAAIFGNPNNRIHFVSVTNDQRIPALQSDRVDIVAHTMTITCKRWQSVDFSTVYLNPADRILVDRNSTATSLKDFSGQKVCAAQSSTPLAYLRSYAPWVTPTVVASSLDCLVLLQEGKVAAISTDDVILAGFEAQDPETKIVGPALENEPYGLAISQQHSDFVRFVNAVLAQMRADGQWAAIYKHWVGTPVPAPPPAHYRG